MPLFSIEPLVPENHLLRSGNLTEVVSSIHLAAMAASRSVRSCPANRHGAVVPMTWIQIIFDWLIIRFAHKERNSPIQLAGDQCVDNARDCIRPPPG
jgi:hypothetical protein